MAEMAVETTLREVARILKEWTAVSHRHTTVGNIVNIKKNLSKQML